MTNLTYMETEFLEAAYGGTAEDLACCLEQGVNVNIQHENNGWSALHFASELDDAEKVRLLLQWKANAHVKDMYNRTPYQVAGGSSARDLLIDYYDENGAGNHHAIDNDQETMRAKDNNIHQNSNNAMLTRATRDIAQIRHDIFVIQACLIAVVAMQIFSIYMK